METSNKIHAILYSLLTAGLIAALLWAFNMNKSIKAYAIDTENNYNRAFHELVANIEDIDSLLSKAQLANDPADLASMSGEIFTKSASAKACLAQLPTSKISLENTARFLSQTGDYTYVLSQNMINGEKISQEQYDTLSSLNDYASKLKTSLADIQTRIYNGELRLSDANSQQKINEVHADSGDILADLENVEKSFDEYPSLIYDGPFSEHIENQQSKMLADAREVTKDEALEIAQSFLGIRGLEFGYASENTAIDSYTFGKTTSEGQLSISITKKGGHVLYFLNSVNVESENIDPSAATDKALDFLKKHGYTNLTSSYYDKSNGVAIINFAANQGDIVCYSDLIKVSVALDTGEIVGMEAKGYIMNHAERELGAPKLSPEEARAKVSTSLEVSHSGLAVIPKDSLREVLCYEFKGSFNGKNFIVYINADNGHEEQILLLLESENGILTV